MGINKDWINEAKYWVFLYENGIGHKRVAKMCNVPVSRVYTYLGYLYKLDKNNISKLKMSELNPQWVGDNVSLSALHAWVKRNLDKPTLCESCKANPALDLANISHKYNKLTYTRDFNNWEWLCRSCHMKKDGRMKNLRQYNETI